VLQSLVELKVVETAWSAELQQGIREKSAWAHLGTVEIEEPSARQTLGGFIDRRTVVVPKGKSQVEALEAWRQTPDGRLIDRFVQKASSALLQRLPPPSARAMLEHPWVQLMPAGPIVLLGGPSDLVHVMRICRALPDASRFRPCAADAPTGGVTAVGGGKGLECMVIVSVAVAPCAEGIAVVGALEARSKGTAKLTRIDVSW
jgi:hypothetical protein